MHCQAPKMPCAHLHLLRAERMGKISHAILMKFKCLQQVQIFDDSQAHTMSKDSNLAQCYADTSPWLLLSIPVKQFRVYISLDHVRKMFWKQPKSRNVFSCAYLDGVHVPGSYVKMVCWTRCLLCFFRPVISWIAADKACNNLGGMQIPNQNTSHKEARERNMCFNCLWKSHLDFFADAVLD